MPKGRPHGKHYLKYSNANGFTVKIVKLTDKQRENQDDVISFEDLEKLLETRDTVKHEA